jgi:hypothetical protein
MPDESIYLYDYTIDRVADGGNLGASRSMGDIVSHSVNAAKSRGEMRKVE